MKIAYKTILQGSFVLIRLKNQLCSFVSIFSYIIISK